MSKVAIRKALEGKLKEFVTTKYPTILIAWENEIFDSTSTGTYLRPVLMPAGVLNPSLGADHYREYGTFVVHIQIDDLNSGTRVVETISDSLVEYFPRGLMLPKDGLTIHVSATPISHFLDVGDKWLSLIVEIPYYCDTIK